jgi:hypothetical protein
MAHRLTAAFLIALPALAATPPLPELRTEPTGGGSIFFVRNVATQPLTSYVIELVGYPGSSYSLWQDETTSDPIPAGAEKRIPVTNMTVGAVPDYVKIQAARYADGSTSGIPEKVAQLVERRKFVVEITRELIRRLEKGGAAKTELIAELKQWSDALPPVGRVNRNSQPGINQAAGRALIADIIGRIDKASTDDALAALRKWESALH